MRSLEDYLKHVKWMITKPQEVMDWGGYAYGFLDFPEIKEMELYDLAWILSHPQSGYCSKGDLEGLIELIEKRMEDLMNEDDFEQLVDDVIFEAGDRVAAFDWGTASAGHDKRLKEAKDTVLAEHKKQSDELQRANNFIKRLEADIEFIKGCLDPRQNAEPRVNEAYQTAKDASKAFQCWRQDE